MSDTHRTRWLGLPATALLAAVLGGVLLVRGDLASGSSTATVRLGGGTMAPPCGTETVRLDVLDVPSPGVGGVTVDLVYDPAMKTPTGCDADPQGCWDAALCNPAYAANTIRVVALHATGIVGGCPLADITWDVCGISGQCTNVDVQIVDFGDWNGQPITAVTDQDALNCVQCPPEDPDTDSDGICDSQDNDDDGDGWTDAAEVYLSTDRLDGCPDNMSDAAWPLDQDNSGTIAFIGDESRYAGMLFTPVTCPSADPNCRLDLDTSGTIAFIGDENRYAGMMFATCSQ